MTKARTIITLTIPAAALLLSACATGLPTRVSRFQAMPSPQGQTFVIEPARAEDRGGLEFAQYADLVRQNLVYQGYRPAAPGEGATLVVLLDYGVDQGRQEIRAYPSARFGGFYDPFYPRFGYGRSPFYYGWNDPFYFGSRFGGGYDIDTRTVYTSYLDMDIKRAADGQAVFEGEAQARSREDELQVLVPSLVEAMFAGFPGRSGETVRITVPPVDQRG